MSHLSWDRANRWLDAGYPLSVVAVVALHSFCNYDTPQLREARPKLLDAPSPDIIQRRVEAYAKTEEASHVMGAVVSILGRLDRPPHSSLTPQEVGQVDANQQVT